MQRKGLVGLYQWLFYFDKNDRDISVDGRGVPVAWFNLFLGLDACKISPCQINWHQLKQPDRSIRLSVHNMLTQT